MLATKRVLECDSIPSLQRNDNRWNRNCASRGSCVILAILLPSSVINSNASSFHAPPVSTAIGTKWCVLAKSVYFAVLFAAALSAAAVALVDVSTMYELANVSGMVMSHASGLPLVMGSASHRLVFCHLTSTTHWFLDCRVLRRFTDLQMISFIWACRICVGALLLLLSLLLLFIY